MGGEDDSMTSCATSSMSLASASSIVEMVHGRVDPDAGRSLSGA
jgi:hypothetical protein